MTALDAAAGERADPAAVRAAVLTLRARKGMVLDAGDHDTWSVGSFFTNPVVAQQDFQAIADNADRPVPNYPAPDGIKLAAGWLVEQAGFGKGYPDDATARCRLSTKHALALTNRGDASCGGRGGAGPHCPRRGPRCVWRHTCARAGAGRLLVVTCS